MSASSSRDSSPGRASDSEFVEKKDLPAGAAATRSRSSSRSSLSSKSSRGSSPLSRRSSLSSDRSSPRFVSATDDSSASEDEKPKEEKKPPVRKAAAVSRKAVSKKVKGSKKKGKKGSEEEGEITSDDDKEFDDGLDEDLIGDDVDRARLAEMTEREREEELYKRAENREALKKRFEIQKKLKHQQKQQKSEGGGGGGKTEDDDDDKAGGGGSSGAEEMLYSNVTDAKERSHDRQKKLDAMKNDKKLSALSELKAKRQERERKDQERQRKTENETSQDSQTSGRGRQKTTKSSNRRSSSSTSSDGSVRSRRSTSSSSSGSASSRSGSDTERFRKSPSKVQKYIETQEDLEPIRLSRHKMERFVHLPFFKKLSAGCFVRIGIGQHQNRSVYRAAEIVDVVETGKVYNVGSVRTNAGVKLKFGKQERVFRLEFVSNQPITPQEFAKWKATCEDSHMALPTLDFVKTKQAEIKKAMNYEYTSDDVDKIVAQKEKFHRHPINYAMHKARLMKEREIAMSHGDEDKAKDLERKLNEHEERAEELDKKRTSTISSVSLINDRNRKANVSKAERAIWNEMKRTKEEGEQSNPFTRRKCNPRIVTKSKIMPWNEDSSTAFNTEPLLLEKENKEELLLGTKRKVEQVVPAAKSSGEMQPPSSIVNSPKKKKAMLEKGASKEDLFDAHDFDIEIDVDTTSGPSNPVNVNLKPVSLTSKSAGPAKRSLNLDDYKKKRGLI